MPPDFCAETRGPKGEVEQSTVTMPNDNSDSEIEDTVDDMYSGYQQLPSEPVPEPEEEDICDSPSTVSMLRSETGVITRTVPSIVINNTSVTCEERLQLNEDSINTIKSCMSNFQIPSSQQPVWAQQISEEVWKAYLLEKMKQ